MKEISINRLSDSHSTFKYGSMGKKNTGSKIRLEDSETLSRIPSTMDEVPPLLDLSYEGSDS